MTTEQSDGACTPSFSSAGLERFSFAELCELLPADVHWGDHLTPDILREVAMAVESRERNACKEACRKIAESQRAAQPAAQPSARQPRERCGLGLE